MAKKKRTIHERENDLVFISERLLSGKTHQEITDELNQVRSYNLDRSQITRDIHKLRERWKAQYLRNFDELKTAELARLDNLEREYWCAWRDSKGEKTQAEETDIEDSTGSNSRYTRKKKVRKVSHSSGNFLYLQGVERVIARRIAILGLIPPKESKISINNWRRQAEEAGIDGEKLVDDLAQQFIDMAMSGKKPPFESGWE